ncbi:MAG TPA: glycosyltransferase family 4 protein [Flavisolibacter sp.]|jgi:glycosyltransferase involved in cell wall biosynthesis|nr:glycosyltransferase family 4 protein [Flavisolibacter sp.]
MNSTALHIAFISFEYPPDTAFGGIGTYTWQMAHYLRQAGCGVTVFAASHTREVRNEITQEGIVVHRIRTARRDEFRERIAELVREQHQQTPFHLIESPEYSAEGMGIKKLLPQVPLLVKFHTPHFLIRELNHYYKKDQFKYRWKRRLGIGRYKKEADPEYQLTLQADAWVAPCESLKQIVHERWQLPLEQIQRIPNPFVPKETFLQIDPATTTETITYLGRLEARKGVHLFAQIIPKVLQQYPTARFRFIGRTNTGPSRKGTMLEYLKETLQPWLSHIEFIDHVEPDAIPGWLSKTDICVFPSLWENFPNVCLEAMSAARGIVASREGGMKDMLEDINPSALVDPLDAEAIATSIVQLLRNPAKRMEQGRKSREKIRSYYATEVPQQLLEGYKKLAGKY